MKRVLPFFITLCISTTLLAQEGGVSDTVNSTNWSSETKTGWLISITLLTLFLVARTLRNKPDA